MSSVGKGGKHTAHQHSLLQAYQSLLYLLVIALFILTFVVQPFLIPSASMEPTLLVGDFLLVDKQLANFPALAPASRIRRGDLIVFHYPVNPSKYLVKRVIGLPSEQLHMHDGHVFLMGARSQSLTPSTVPRRRTAIATTSRRWIAPTPPWIRDGGSRCTRW